MANPTWLEVALNGGWGRHRPSRHCAGRAHVGRGALLAAGSSLAAPAEVRRALNGH